MTHDSHDKHFAVHQELDGKPNMIFKMHLSGPHCFNPDDKEFMFISTVSENMKDFMKQQVQHAKVARVLYCKLGFPSIKDFKWVAQSDQIWDCPVTVTNIEVASKIWGKDIAMLKGKTMRNKPLPVSQASS